ncbi:dUTP diphosphatase [Abyssisolibacter fermentans]|uniref:dUTP diphosphatase n=1 Tax=Abyssisolibacter fermentans TaxID=1766203 RepID=UPI000833FDDC|nr:dUTP diphosphatase [Abyssisolibacter fermentans]
MKNRGFEVVADKHRKHLDKSINIPKRGSKTSAGYDFYSTETFTLKHGEKFVVWTDIKAYMLEGEVLNIYVRSSIGIKKGLVLANGTGIIDQDYYNNPSNDGNIGICLINISKEEVTIEEGERIAQAIFIQFLPADNGNSLEERKGGLGSTGE